MNENETILSAIQILQKRLNRDKKIIIAQKQEIARSKKRVYFSRTFEKSKGTYSIACLAKLLAQAGVKTGQNRLFDYLRENGFLGTKGVYYNVANQRYIEQGLFKLKKCTFHVGDEVVEKEMTVVTGKGMTYFFNKLTK